MFPKKTIAALGVPLAAAVIWWKASQPVVAKSLPAPPPPEITVAVVKAEPRPLRRQLTLSSELVPFQQIDVYAKESGFVKQLYVDYGSHVKAGQVIATLEIPELQAQLQADDATVSAFADQIKHAEDLLRKVQAQENVAHLEYERLYNVGKSSPGLLAQQEIDDAQGKDLAAAAQVESGQANVAVAESQLSAAQAKRARDQVLFDYSKITAPFSGVITKRYANLGTLVQAGTSSSTQVLPLVQLSQDNLFRLVIPVPESYVRDIRIGDTVKVFIPSLNETFPGRVARFSADVSEDTRTMHTEVDVPNPRGNLMPGLYADATLKLAGGDVLAVPVQAVHRDDDQISVDVVDAGGRLESRNVTLGVESANYAAIDSGLSRGDLVVISDPGQLAPGEKVRAQIVPPSQYQRPEEEQQGS